MNIFKETFQLVKMLFSDIEKTNEVKTYPMSHFPFSGYKYMMWCGSLIYRDKFPQYRTLKEIDKNHEMIHLHQAKDCGSWTKFYLSYLWAWICKNPFRKSAYYRNKYEVEAYAKENDLTYLERREKNNVDKFKKYNVEFTTPYLFKSSIKIYFKDI